jgi:nucleotide-binding universal stress UspA family protein
LPKEAQALIVSVADVHPALEIDSLQPICSASVPRAVRKARSREKHLLEQTRQTAQSAAEQLKAKFSSWQIDWSVSADSPVWGIVKAADRWKPDLVVLGSHSRSGLGRLFLGSVSQTALMSLRDSVRIARAPQREEPIPFKMVVALDGSEDAWAAIEEIGRRSWVPWTEIQVVIVMGHKLGTAVPKPGSLGYQWVREHDQEGDERISRMAAHATAKLQHAGLRAECHILTGNPKDILLERIGQWQADTVFAGAAGIVGGKQGPLGTVACALAMRAPCSVEIIRSRELNPV